MSGRSRQRVLHVANGTSTTMTIEAAGLAGRCSIWADPLHEGPVPGGLSDADLVEVRRRFLGPAPDGGSDLQLWRDALARHETYDELILWFEHDLFDQLNLMQLLTWIRDHLPDTVVVSLVCIDAFPGRPDFRGLGELTPGELAPLVETRQAVTPAQFALARRTWDAFRQPTPEALEVLRAQDTSALPFLAAALTRLLQEYPATGDGLSRSERRLLALAADAGATLRQLFPRMGDGERAYHMTDLSLDGLVRGLAATSPALLTIDDRAAGAASPWHAVITLTDAGRAVLAGRLDRVATCGIDRWLGGVHLTGREVAWRWDERRQQIVAG